MRQIYQKYLDNLAKSNELVKKTLLNASGDKETFIEELRSNSRTTSELRKENDKLLQEILYSRSAAQLTEEDVQDLFDLANQLFKFLHQADIGTAYRIHQLLFEHAVLTNNRNLKIRQLYEMGTALFYMNPIMVELGVNPFGKKVADYFSRGAEYISQYEEISDPKTRGYILRCMTNLCLTDERITCTHQPGTPYDNISTYFQFKKFFNWMMEFYKSSYYHVLTPDFPWETAVYNLNYNLALYHRFLQTYHPKEVIQDVLDAATHIYKHQEQLPKFKYSDREMHVEQIYASARWKAGLISTTELADTIYSLFEHADPNDFSMNGITLNLQMPLNFEYAYRCMNRKEQQLYQEKMDLLVQHTNDYLRRAPHNEFSNLVTKNVAESIRYRAQHNLPLGQQFFNSLLFCHPPTCIHVRMTALLCRKVFLRMMDVHPEALLGLYDIYDVEELQTMKEDFAERIYLCALYHDVGKIMLLDYIGIYVRPLLDEEFTSIKLHTNIGSALLEKTDPKELSVVALHHHRWYNEVGGYPDACPPCQPQYKPIVDIVTVCDCIEAATDNIGRCYNEPKTLRQIVDNMKPGAGTRYSPYVLALFDDEDFFRETEELIETERMNIYYETYLNAEKNFLQH